MGIKGLRQYLEAKLDGVIEDELIPANAVLCIDGDGWVFHLVELCGSAFRRELGGNYAVLASVTAAEIERLRKDCKLQLRVFFDGKNTSPLKGYTALQRRRQREDSWEYLYEYCSTEGCCNGKPGTSHCQSILRY